MTRPARKSGNSFGAGSRAVSWGSGSAGARFSRRCVARWDRLIRPHISVSYDTETDRPNDVMLTYSYDGMMK